MRGEFGDVDFLPGWRGKSPVQDLAQIFNLPVALENDGDAAALAESGWGAGRNRSRLIYVTVGTGIGGGIILDGKLYRGVDGAHPEVGHQFSIPRAGLLVRLSRLLGIAGRRSSHGGVAAGHAACGLSALQRHHSEENLRTAQLGDKVSLQAVEHEAYYLGLGLANLINLFTP